MDQVMSVLLTGILVVLVLNLVAALLAFRRAGFGENWLLVILLTGTTGAGMVALLLVLLSLGGDDAEPPLRLLDVTLILTGTAALTAVVRAAASAGRRRSP